MSLAQVFANALPIIREAAPIIAGALSGPQGIALDVVVPILAKAFGTDNHNLSDLANAIVTHPDAHDKLAQLQELHGDILKNLNTLASVEINIKLTFSDNSHG